MAKNAYISIHKIQNYYIAQRPRIDFQSQSERKTKDIYTQRYI